MRAGPSGDWPEKVVDLNIVGSAHFNTVGRALKKTN